MRTIKVGDPDVAIAELQAMVGIPRCEAVTRGSVTARPITAKYLQNAAAFYLERYPSTAEGLRRVLNRRVAQGRDARGAGDGERASRRSTPSSPSSSTAGVIDDKAFAQTKARALHRRGTSTRLTRQKLKMAGDRRRHARQGDGRPRPGARHRSRASANGRRRWRWPGGGGSGPFRPEGPQGSSRTRDLAAMARAGFDYRALPRR